MADECWGTIRRRRTGHRTGWKVWSQPCKEACHASSVFQMDAAAESSSHHGQPDGHTVAEHCSIGVENLRGFHCQHLTATACFITSCASHCPAGTSTQQCPRAHATQLLSNTCIYARLTRADQPRSMAPSGSACTSAVSCASHAAQLTGGLVSVDATGPCTSVCCLALLKPCICRCRSCLSGRRTASARSWTWRESQAARKIPFMFGLPGDLYGRRNTVAHGESRGFAECA